MSRSVQTSAEKGKELFRTALEASTQFQLEISSCCLVPEHPIWPVLPHVTGWPDPPTNRDVPEALVLGREHPLVVELRKVRVRFGATHEIERDLFRAYAARVKGEVAGLGGLELCPMARLGPLQVNRMPDLKIQVAAFLPHNGSLWVTQDFLTEGYRRGLIMPATVPLLETAKGVPSSRWFELVPPRIEAREAAKHRDEPFLRLNNTGALLATEAAVELLRWASNGQFDWLFHPATVNPPPPWPPEESSDVHF